jgi:hypothetical protein
MNIGDDMSRTRPGPNRTILSGIAARRLSNQIDRAHRGTFGAQTGLQTIVKAVAREMRRAGASPDVISATITNHVVNHSAPPAWKPNGLASGHLSSTMLIDLVQQCVNEVAVE